MVDITNPMMPDFTGGPVNFFKEVRAELSKIIWPTKEEIIKLTAIVIGISLVIGIYIGALDMLFLKITGLFVAR
jgi:preprotein translocase subunit SecE